MNRPIPDSYEKVLTGSALSAPETTLESLSLLCPAYCNA